MVSSDSNVFQLTVISSHLAMLVMTYDSFPQGVKVKMDDQGNILIKRVSKAGVYVKIGSDDNAISNEILKLPNCALETEKPVMVSIFFRSGQVIFPVRSYVGPG